MKRDNKVVVRGNAPADLDEQEALAAAVEAIRTCHSAEDAAVHGISAWIRKRAELCAGKAMVENCATNFGDARLRGVITAALPHIGEALSDLPPDVAFFDLSKETVIDALTTACAVIREYDLRAKERGDFSLDDPIPW